MAEAVKVYVCCICRNEERLLPYFLRHYEQFATKMVFWDDHSTDATRSLLAAHPRVTLHDWPGPSGIVDEVFKEFAEREYKRFRGETDWIIWADADEIIYHPDMLQLLRVYQDMGVQVPLVQGYGMVSHRMPTGSGQIYDEIRTGYAAPTYAKPVVFRSNVDMRWHHGKHQLADGFTPYRSQSAELKLLHYRWLDPEYVQYRNQNNWNRMPEKNRQGGFGWTTNPTWHGEGSYDWYINIQPNQIFKVL